MRIAHDGSASPGPVYKLQVYLAGLSAGHNFRLYEYNAIGYNGGVASESMTAVSGSWTTITERDFPTSQSGITTTDLLVNNRIYSDGIIRVGTSTFTDYKASQQYSNGTYEVAIPSGSFKIADGSNNAKFTITPSTGAASFTNNLTVGGATNWAGNDTQTCAIYLNNSARGLSGNFANYARNLVKANSQYVEVGQNSTLVYGVKFIVGSNAPNGFMFQSNIGGTMTTHMGIRGDTGSVGIGTGGTAPYAYDTTATKFEVSTGTTTVGEVEVARFRGGDDADTGAAIVRITNDNDRGLVLKGGRVGGSGNASAFADIGVSSWDGSFTRGIRIDGAGRCGIGIAAPYAPLQVHNSADQAVVLSGATNPYIRWQSGSSNKAYVKWENANSTFVIRNESANTELRYSSTGLGIGGTPSSPLTLHMTGVVMVQMPPAAL